MRRASVPWAALAAAVALAGCATVPGPTGPGAAAVAPPGTGAHHDPFQRMNRGLFALGEALDRTFVRPVMAVYHRVAPRPVRHAVHNVVQNLDEPVVFLNDVLQVHPKAAATTAVRFFANSTVGVGGIFDAASTAGLEHHDNGFGSTLGRYGVGTGPYLYIPVFGPTTLRDAVGDGVDWFTDPFALANTSKARAFDWTRTVVSLLDEREQADEELRALQSTSVDPYASLRSVYFQSRAAEVNGAGATELEPLPAFPDAPETAPPSAATPEPQAAEPPSPAPEPTSTQAPGHEPAQTPAEPPAQPAPSTP
ncbi:MAG: VacJ family lipoprotein [Alphaproteobacteria bacterium]|nr:VacJ family lipoprotein [Alphaproteobacteria bacterium]